ncbi:MAG: hypothetical protein Terrestrivirus1_151 [Terrestrivirus sp.]|uniref:Uncharacterized protein n=1 Tax=Terrestrivirus sp. TaxID=2487775 RepID=A0A3G4ZKB6_9VIRU|nr:MAG: hypothetical protein Terrestrivirus1_151 [Terrestrivirus sp.]
MSKSTNHIKSIKCCPHCSWVREGQRVSDNVNFSIGGMPNTLRYITTSHDISFDVYCTMICDVVTWLSKTQSVYGISPSLFYAGTSYGKKFHGYGLSEYEHFHCWAVFGTEEESRPYRENSLIMKKTFGDRSYVKCLEGKSLSWYPYKTDRFVTCKSSYSEFSDPKLFKNLFLMLFNKARGFRYYHGKDMCYIFLKFSSGEKPIEFTLSVPS